MASSADFCRNPSAYGLKLYNERYGGTGIITHIKTKKVDGKEIVEKACLMNKNGMAADAVGVVCGDLDTLDLTCCYDEDDDIQPYFWYDRKECENWFEVARSENLCTISEGPKPKPDENKYGCEVVGFELPQKIAGDVKSKAKEWILNTGDPQTLVYWQKWPQGEEAAWMGLLDWAENTLTVFLVAAGVGVGSSCVAGKMTPQEIKEVEDKILTKLSARVGSRTVNLVKGAKDVAGQSIKSTKDVARILGLEKAKNIGKNLVIAGGVGGYTLSQGVEYWVDSISYKFEKEKGNTLFLINPGRKGYEFPLGENTKKYHVILERSWATGGDDVSFYLASPCKADLKVTPYPVKTEDGKEKSKYACGNELDKLTCGIVSDEPVWTTEGRCTWNDDEEEPLCASYRLAISEQFRKCIDSNPGDDEEALKARLACFYKVVDANKDKFTDEECGCFDYSKEMEKYVKDVDKAVEEVCGEKPEKKITYLYVNEEQDVEYCRELHGRFYPYPAEYLDAIEVQAENPYPEYQPNYCFATASKSYAAFKVLDLGSTIFLGWNPAGACVKRAAFSLAGAAVFTQLSKVTSWPGHTGW